MASRQTLKLAQNYRLFLTNERGATMLEFALLAPIFFGIIGAILQTSIVFLAGQFLESAVQNASRVIRTGEAQQSNWELSDFRALVCDGLYGMLSCPGMHIEVDNVDNFRSAISPPPYDFECRQDCGWTRDETWVPGPASSVVLVQVHYKFPLVLPFAQLSSNVLADGSQLLSAAAVFRNEPF